jgi:hypothetical protein
MRRAVALGVMTFALAACSSTVTGRPRTDSAAVPGGPSSSAAVPSSPGRSDPLTTPATADPGADATPGTGATPGTEATSTEATSTEATSTELASTDATDPETPTPDAMTSTDTPTAPAQLPSGFYAAGPDLGYRPMTTDEFDCTPDQASGCFGFMVFSVPGCPAGANVTVGIFDKSRDPDNALGTAAGTTPPITPIGSQAVVIADTTGIAANLTARVQQVVC